MQKPLTMFHNFFAISFAAISFCIPSLLRMILFSSIFSFLFGIFFVALIKNSNRDEQKRRSWELKLAEWKRNWESKSQGNTKSLALVRYRCLLCCLYAVFFRALWLWKCTRAHTAQWYLCTRVAATAAAVALDVKDFTTNSTNTFHLALLTFSLYLYLSLILSSYYI